MTLEELDAAFRAEMQPDFRYADAILDRAKGDPIMKALATLYVRTADTDERAEAMMAMGFHQAQPKPKARP